MRTVRIAGVIFFFVSLGGVASAAEQWAGIVPPGFSSPAQRDLYDRLSSRLIAPCCWGEAVRLHQSDAAGKVRFELIGFIRAGLNEGEIQDRFAREYGERILGQPRGAKTVVAYSIPATATLIGLVSLSLFLRGRNRRHADALSNSASLPDLQDSDW